MGIESRGYEPEPPREEVPPETIHFPFGEVAVEAYAKEYAHRPERVELLRDVFQELFEQELNHSAVFRSSSGVEMPYTYVSVTELARTLYEKESGIQLPTSEEPVRIHKKKFVYGTAPALSEGDQFTTVEIAMHDCVKKLPAALERLCNGEAPKEEQIVTMGMPTNVLGKIPADQSERIIANPYEELAKDYAELVATESAGEHGPGTIELHGMSLGSSLAIRTGEALLERQVVTQDHAVAKERGLPYLEIRADVPVALADSKLKSLKIPVGFAVEGVMDVARRPEVRKTQLLGGKFRKAIWTRLAERGIEQQMDPEQKKIKKKTMLRIILDLGKGLVPKPGTKVNEVYGLKDPTSTTRRLRSAAREQKAAHVGSLGQNTLERKSDGRRTFAVDMSHLQPWFRENELQRMDVLAAKLLGTKVDKLYGLTTSRP